MSAQGNLNASILDRLIDQAPASASEAAGHRFFTLAQIRVRVIRDLEHLLNTRAIIFDAPAACGELGRSLYAYGLRDFTTLSPKSEGAKKVLRQEIERAIMLFEPRLRQVRVMLEADQRAHSLVFRVNALLVIEPEREPVQFDAYYDINRGCYQVKG